MPIGRVKTNRAMSDRGRYPEEAGGEEDNDKRDDTPSEEDDEASLTAVGSFAGSTIPMAQQQTYINLNILEDAPMLESFRNSPAGSFTSGMEVDMVSIITCESNSHC